MIWEVDIITALVIGAATSVLAIFIQQVLRKPVLTLKPDKDWYDPKFSAHYVHVRVNVPRRLRLFLPRPAYEAHSQLKVVCCDGPARPGESLPGTFETKWARNPVDLYGRNPPTLRRLDIYPGVQDGGRAGAQLDIAVKGDLQSPEKGAMMQRKNDTTVLIHDPQLFFDGVTRRNCTLREGLFYAGVSVHHTEGLSKEVFLLANNGTSPGGLSLNEADLASQQKRELYKRWGW